MERWQTLSGSDAESSFYRNISLAIRTAMN
jgi:hypothetical protein